MARNINLFLVRHAVSEANLDKSVNARLPDNQVPLAQQGKKQAVAAGHALADFIAKNCPESTRILCSPYLRTRQTAFGIEDGLRAANLPFDKREELALREISFGLFDGIADEELPKAFPLESAHYRKHKDFEGEFYAPMPMGESRAQVADRVKGVFGTIIRDNQNGIRNFIIVSHGVTLRAFEMQWMHHSPEWYQAQKNPNNASIRLIHRDVLGNYAAKQIYGGFPYERTKQEEREEGKA